VTEGDFWQIVANLAWDANTDDAVLEPAIVALAEFGDDEIIAFDEILARRLSALDGEDYARHIGEHAYRDDDEDEYFSPDLFLYARCFVVAQGREFYDAVLRNPGMMPKNRQFEALLDLPRLAYERRTGRAYAHVPATDYETFSNRRGWSNE
jgi:hypothetical protein